MRWRPIPLAGIALHMPKRTNTYLPPAQPSRPAAFCTRPLTHPPHSHHCLAYHLCIAPPVRPIQQHGADSWCCPWKVGWAAKLRGGECISCWGCCRPHGRSGVLPHALHALLTCIALALSHKFVGSPTAARGSPSTRQGTTQAHDCWQASRHAPHASSRCRSVSQRGWAAAWPHGAAL